MRPFSRSRFSATVRWMLVLAVLAVPQIAQAQWHAAVGAQSGDKARQALAFLPNEIWIHPGESITWNFATDTDHTVSLLRTASPAQIRPPATAGCPGATLDGSSFDGSACVNSGSLPNGQTYRVMFPAAGNYKIVCLVHANMTAVVHVLPASDLLPHDQAFYDKEAARQSKNLLLDRDQNGDDDVNDASDDSGGLAVAAGAGEIVATPGGSMTLSVNRFMKPTIVIHAGQTVEWTNEDPVTAHTITFGTEPVNPIPPSSNVTLDADLARHATITAPTDNVHSGFIVAGPQDRIGLVQTPLPPVGNVTRFRVTFTQAGNFPYICALHDGLGMKGEVIVLP